MKLTTRQPKGPIAPAALFSSKYKEAALSLCRELVRRGLTHQRFWTKGSPLPQNHFRTYVTEPTAKLPRRFKVRYQDWTLGPRVPVPAKPARPKSKDLPEKCANADAGCPRDRVYLDGYCKRCHDRREYWSNPALRERKKANAAMHKKARRDMKREAA